MPKQGVEKKKTGGGGKVEPFTPVTDRARQKLVDGLDSAEQLLALPSLQNRVVPLKASLVTKALAKSHWQNALFDESSCPVIGAGKPGEIFLRGSRRGISMLKRRVERGDTQQVVKEISALKELKPVAPADRLSGQTPRELFAAAPTAHGRRAVKVKLFDFGGAEMQAHERAAFEAGLQANAISFVRHPQYKGQDVYTATCKTEGDVGFLSGLLSVRSVGLIPMFRTLREYRMNSRPLPDGSLPGEADPASFPIVAVVDSGVMGGIPDLEGWVYTRERFVAKAEENTYHGTFVAGLLVWGHGVEPGATGDRAASVPHSGHSRAAEFGSHLWCGWQHY